MHAFEINEPSLALHHTNNRLQKIIGKFNVFYAFQLETQQIFHLKNIDEMGARQKMGMTQQRNQNP